MLAVDALSAGWQFFFYLVAVICFVLAAVSVVLHARLNLVALGLGCFAFVFMWQALANV